MPPFKKKKKKNKTMKMTRQMRKLTKWNFKKTTDTPYMKHTLVIKFKTQLGKSRGTN